MMTKTNDAKRDGVRVDINISDFIPFACHYNPHTILTKNGELLQTIKIVGFAAENISNKKEDNKKRTLRGSVRKAIQTGIDNDEYAIWFHTVRRKKKLSAEGEYSDQFSKYTNSAWRKRHDWDHKYVNELYITIIREGESFSFESYADYIKTSSYKVQKKAKNLFLEKIYDELDEVVKKVVQSLSDFGAKRLSMFEYKGVFYSENLRFLSKIINFAEYNFPVKEQDLSHYLPINKVSFGFNALEVKGANEKHFAGILSVKEYHEVSANAIDTFLQLPFEFILTETVDFINREKALKGFEYQKYILNLSQDKHFSEISGITEIINSDKGRVTDFGEHQISIMVIEDHLKLLESEINKMQEVLATLGILSVREDIMMEDCFWAQLPGNFSFIRRLTPINTNRMGGFASLYNFPAGKLTNNHWGPAVTIFYTAAGTPYFFNFHVDDNGHTAIIGPFGAGKTVLMNFMLSEARKYNSKLFFFDQMRASEIFIRAIGGKYVSFEETKNKYLPIPKMNPLLLAENEENIKFLKAWLQYLVSSSDNGNEDETIKERLVEIVKIIFALPAQERKLSQVRDLFEKMDMAKQAAALEVWYGSGRYSYLFDNDDDDLNIAHIQGFDMTFLVKEGKPLGPVLSYLFHRIREKLDGEPTIIVLDEAWSLIDNAIFAPHISEWLDFFRERNAMVIFATESVEDASKSKITTSITSKLATRIFLPNQYATGAYKKVFGLNHVEFDLLNMMSKKRRSFLLKHGEDAVVAELDLSGLDEIISILSGTPENIKIMEGIMNEVGETVDKWLPAFIFKKKAKK